MLRIFSPTIRFISGSNPRSAGSFSLSSSYKLARTSFLVETPIIFAVFSHSNPRSKSPETSSGFGFFPMLPITRYSLLFSSIPKMGRRTVLIESKVAGYSSSLMDLDVLIAAPPSLRDENWENV